MKKISSSTLISFLLTLILIFTALGYYFYQTSSTPNISLVDIHNFQNPNSLTITTTNNTPYLIPGEEQELKLVYHNVAGLALSAVDATISYDPTQAQITNISPADLTNSLTTPLISNNGLIHLAYAVPTSSTGLTQDKITVATFIIDPIEYAPLTLTLTNETEAASQDTGDENIVGTLISPTFDVRLPTDFNSDGTINAFDFSIFLAEYGKTGEAYQYRSDVNGDGEVNIYDYNTFLSTYGQTI